MSHALRRPISNPYLPWPGVLTGLFLFRVVAQPLTLFYDTPFLPPFDHWHSGALPYYALLSCQIIILTLLIRVVLGMANGRITPIGRLGAFLFPLGVIHFVAMVIRLALGLTELSNHHWFTRHIPTFFHLVLATFVLLLGKFHAAQKTEGAL